MEQHARREALRMAKLYMRRAERLADRIEEAFGKELFDLELSPVHRANVKRFDTYCSMLRRAFELHCDALELVLRFYGLKPDLQEWVMAGAGVTQQPRGLQLSPDCLIIAANDRQMTIEWGEAPNSSQVQ
jgi:hypothetical protein